MNAIPLHASTKNASRTNTIEFRPEVIKNVALSRKGLNLVSLSIEIVDAHVK
jgi:hypothetical protein